VWSGWYPVAIAAAFVLYMQVETAVHIFGTVRSLVVATVATALLLLVARRLVRDRELAALTIGFVLVALVSGLRPGILVLVLACSLLLQVTRRASRSDGRPASGLVTRLAASGASVACLVVVVAGIQRGSFERTANELGSWLRQATAAPIAAGQSDASPDIYLLLLDGHARADTFERVLGGSDRAFLAQLEERGFEVASHSRSNYLATGLTFASMFNMAHIADLDWPLGLVPTDPNYHVALRERINENEAFRLLREREYRITALASGFADVNVRAADRFIDTGQPNEFELWMLRTTGLAGIVTAFAPDLFAELHRARVNAVFEKLPEIAAERPAGPRFVFVHLPSPHAPFVFGPSGEPTPPGSLDVFFEDTAIGRGLSRSEYARAYTNQAAYIDRRTIETIDRIRAASADPPVILVMSDHGSAAGFDWHDIEGSDIEERSANLFAALTPGRSGVFGDTITTVNIFPRLFDSYFGLAIPDRPNTVYRWKGESLLDVVPVAVDP
jgi:hypothetical protein